MSELGDRFEGKAKELVKLCEKYDKIINYLHGVDPELWKKQRTWLLDLQDDPVTALDHDSPELAEGLTNFLDGLTDLMTDELGIKGLLLTEGEEEDGEEGEAEGP